MSIQAVCYVIAIVFFAVAALNRWGPALAVGLAFFAAGHVLAGIALR